MNALAAQQLNHVLPKAAQPDAGASECWICAGHAKDIALGRIGIHAQQQIGRREIEKTQSVRLNGLRQVQARAAALQRSTESR